MEDAKIVEAYNKMEKVFLDWYHTDEVLMTVACMFDKLPNPKQKTIGIDVKGKRPILYFNPNFVNSISKEKLELVLVSECFKVLLKHATTRLKKPTQISAMASTVTITELMNSELQNMLGNMENVKTFAEQYGLEKNQCFEEYYRNMLDRMDEITEQFKKMWNEMSDEEKQKFLENAEYVEFDSDSQAIGEYFNPFGTSNDGWSENEIFESTLDNFVNEKKNSSKGWGKHTGNAMSIICAAYEPKISCEQIVKNFRKSTISVNKVSSRMRVNRRFDLDAPGVKRLYKSKIIFSTDVSGSVDDRALSKAFAVINKVFKYADVEFVQFDTEIKHIEKKFKRARDTFKVYGRGGTDFQCIIDYAKDQKADGLIIYTDGRAEVPTENFSKVLWLMTDKDNTPPVPWGRVAYLDD